MILLVGATGALGGDIAQRLRRAGHPVRALVRDGSAAEALRIVGVQIAVGDLKDPPSLRVACAETTTVIATATSAARGGADTVESVEVAGNRSLIDAAAAAHIGQFIFVSALGAEPDSPVPFLRGKSAAEQHLIGSGVPYTILKPNLFMETWIGSVVAEPVRAGRPVLLAGPGQRKHSFVSRHDVASFVLATLGATSALNRTLIIGGPEPLSWRDVIAKAETIIGRTIEVQSAGPGQAPAGTPAIVGQLLAATEAYDSPIDMTELAYTFGVSLTPVGDVLRSLLQR